MDFLDALSSTAHYLGVGIAYVGVAGGIAAIVAAVLRRWRAARGFSCAAIVAVFLVPLLLSAELLRPMDAFSKARVWAGTISEVLNCTAFAALGALVAAPVWIISGTQIRRQKG
jgi:hypothetical protein